MKVAASAITQPSQNSVHSTSRPAGAVTSQITAGIVRHCQYSSTSTALDSTT